MFDKKISILDGGLGSTLQDKGHDVDVDPLWSARLLQTNPEAIFNVHTEFLNAGAEILSTASYQASQEGFKKHLDIGFEESLNLIKESVFLAKKAREQAKDAAIVIAGSVGPYGACQADGSEYDGLYTDSITEDDLKSWHQPRIDTLIKAGVDIIALETIPSLKEALAIIRLLKNYQIKFWVSFVCKDETHTCYGDDFGYAFEKVLEVSDGQVVAIGVNCTNPQFVTPLLTRASKRVPVSAVPRIVYPNLGETWISGVGWSKKTTIKQFIENEDINKWIDLGAKVIGGCCRVSPHMINQLSTFIKNK